MVVARGRLTPTIWGLVSGPEPRYPAGTPMAPYHLVVVYAGQGFRWPFRAGDGIEVWSPDGHLLGVVPQGVVLALLTHAVRATELQAEVRLSLARVVPAPGRAARPPRLRALNGRRLRVGKESTMRIVTLLLGALGLAACAYGGPVMLPPPAGVPEPAWSRCEDEAKATAMLNRARAKAYFLGGVIGVSLAKGEPAPPGPFQPQNPQEADTFRWTWQDCARKAGYPVDPGPEPGALKRTF